MLEREVDPLISLQTYRPRKEAETSLLISDTRSGKVICRLAHRRRAENQGAVARKHFRNLVPKMFPKLPEGPEGGRIDPDDELPGERPLPPPTMKEAEEELRLW